MAIMKKFNFIPLSFLVNILLMPIMDCMFINGGVALSCCVDILIP